MFPFLGTVLRFAATGSAPCEGPCCKMRCTATVQALSARTFCASKDRRSSPGAANLATVFRQACARL